MIMVKRSNFSPLSSCPSLSTPLFLLCIQHTLHLQCPHPMFDVCRGEKGLRICRFAADNWFFFGALLCAWLGVIFRDKYHPEKFHGGCGVIYRRIAFACGAGGWRWFTVWWIGRRGDLVKGGVKCWGGGSSTVRDIEGRAVPTGCPCRQKRGGGHRTRREKPCDYLKMMWHQLKTET